VNLHPGDIGAPDDGLTTAAVLVPLFRDAAGELRVVLVVRGDRGVHGGQIGLPGGKPEPGDVDLLDTALRETEEEIGVSRDQVEVIAALPEVVTRTTGFRVFPFLGAIPDGLTWTLRHGEIVDVLSPPIATLAAPDARTAMPFTSPQLGRTIEVEGVDLEGRILWGMTLRLLDLLVPRILAGEWELP
jgi:8-oxo-dGTP pyrophosphatase MutT (NUDIX family)